jgi:hypothetical protein
MRSDSYTKISSEPHVSTQIISNSQIKTSLHTDKTFRIFYIRTPVKSTRAKFTPVEFACDSGAIVVIR